jgi:gamma-glutamyltranspeptidase/glutathione hydrolase
MEVLEAGGNAFDAAVAVTAALGVVEPYGSGLGGGGFWLLHRALDGRQVMVDGRETAPAAAHRDLYLDEAGEVVPKLSVDGALAAAIPGTPAALDHLARHYGRRTLAENLAPAIRLAREGFQVGASYRRMAAFRLDALSRSDAAADTFLVDYDVPPLGHRLRQPDLAATLQALARQGRDGFYRGPVAEALVRGVREAGGIWTLRDLADYRVKERQPVVTHYRGVRVVSASPPSSGGVALATMLHILAGFPLEELEPAARTHLLVEAMRLAYRDRAIHLGDPDQVYVPVRKLTHPLYGRRLGRLIDPDRALDDRTLDRRLGRTGRHTTHFSILDRQGNRVAATLSINYPFGSGLVPAGTGVLLNDEMDDFAAKPGVPNLYGLVGAEANAIAPGKRPLSSMSPTFLETRDRVGILGTPGGSRIITMVLLGALEFAQGSGPEAWVTRPRFHHQYLPDEVQAEPGALSPEVIRGLEARGHTVRELSDPYGNMQAVLWDRRAGRVEAASDPRGEGAALVR